ncbi:hypothetical protein C8Q76DRAFT_798958 [Earliella scabrosa]|nr:hypothetical protein C8Q76DRAFT_798958 [Earliella scabrosa]
MSNNSDSYSEFFRRRTLGRAPSPPTWACYEQIPYEDDYSDSASDNNSCSEDEEDYDHVGSDGERPSPNDSRSGQIDGDMEIDEGDEPMSADRVAEMKKDLKGKQRAVEHYESPKREHRKKPRQPVFTLRPILTIQKSQGFVWNQDLFVPPYIKDRYVASTSPSNSHGFVSSSVSSTNSSMMDYEVEVVEIRVREGELNDIIP